MGFIPNYRCLYIAGYASLAFAACACAPEQAEETNTGDALRPNVVFLLVDDLGYTDIGAYNSGSFYETPNIDALAARGILFTHSYAASPVCSPSRAALMTGKHPTRMQATDWFHSNNFPHRVERFRPGVNLEYMAAEETTIAEIFEADGYKTAFLGKWHLGEEAAVWPKNQGFDVNIGGTEAGFPRGGYFSPYNNPNLADGPEGEYLTDRLTDEAIDLIKDYGAAADPFFLYLSYYTVHAPFDAPVEIVSKYERKSSSLPEGPTFAREDQYHLAPSSPREVRIVQDHPTYAAMIEKLDDNVGRIISALHNADVADNTIIVFTSDNGGLSTAEGHPTSNLPFRGGKGWLYEGGIRVPLIIKPLDSENGGRRSDYPTVSMDLLPTLTSLAGIAPDQSSVVDGVDLSTEINSQHAALPAKDRELYWHYPHYSNQGGFPGAAIRVGHHKLLQNFEDGSIQLFDLSSDPAESIDISGSQPAVVNDLKTRLNTWYTETNAQFLRPREDALDALPWRPDDATQ